jgi:hypothetical protein
MRNLILLAGGIFLSFVALAQKPATTALRNERELSFVEFETGEGRVTAVLPSHVRMGDVISGTVLAEPQGKNERQLSKNAQLLNGYVIEMENEPSPAKKGRFTWKMPASVAGGVVGLVLKDNLGRILARQVFPVLDGPGTTPSGKEALEGFPAGFPVTDPVLKAHPQAHRPFAEGDAALPGYLRAGQNEKITGFFDGDSRNSVITLGGAELEVLAESPEGIFFAVPDTLSGRHTLGITEQNKTFTGEVNIVNLSLSADKLTLTRGETTRVTIEVSGLDGLDSSLPLTLSNLTPGNITLKGGNEQQKTLDPKQAGPSGILRETAEVTATRSGAFSVLVTLGPPESQLLRIETPVVGSLPAADPLVVVWTAKGFPEGTRFNLSVYAIPEEPASALSGESKDPVCITEGSIPVYSATRLSGNMHSLPGEWENPDGNQSQGLFAIRVEAADPVTGALLGEASSWFQTISASRKCRCGDNASSFILADIRLGDLVVARASLSQNPSNLELPSGPLSLRFTEASLDCGNCSRTPCEVANVVYVPAVPVILPGTSIQTLDVRVTWDCILDGCITGSCEKTFKLKYSLAPDKCECGDVAVTVEARNVNASKPANLGTRSTVTSHRPAGSSGTAILQIGNTLLYESGDEVEIVISGIQPHCWCQDGLCNPEPTDRDDVRSGKPLTIDLGENDADASNDNHNMIRVAQPGDGWQTDDSYRIHVRFRNAQSNTRDVYQDFTLKYWCIQEDCSRSLCDKKFRIHFGFF